MRSSEFLNEAGPEGTPMTDAEFAAQQAQGAKNLDSIKGFGRKIAGALGGGAQAATPYPDAATARASLTPSQLKWLGGADPMDKYIMARMPAALPGETVAAVPAAVAAPVKTAGTGYGDDDTSVFAAPAPTPVANAVAASGEPDNVTGVDAAVAANAANTANAQATTPPGKATPVSDPKVLALQQQLIAAGAKIKADGRMGPATVAAQKRFGGNVTDANQSSAETARLARANTGAATAVANQSSAETARLAKAGTVPPRPSILTAKAGEQAAWDRQYAKTNNTDGTPTGGVRESNFEESVSRMRRLSTLLKG